jgi:hypothetical protein
MRRELLILIAFGLVGCNPSASSTIPRYRPESFRADVTMLIADKRYSSSWQAH